MTATPLHRQLYEGLRSAILSGQLARGHRAPSTRALASELGLSRTTVLAAYQQLIGEGYLESRRGSGAYVAQVLPDELLISPTSANGESRRLAQAPHTAIRASFGVVEAPPTLAFRVGLPALDAFPSALWGRLLAHRYRASSQTLFGYQHPAGYLPLRQALAGYLSTARGVRCTPDQILIVSGSQQGLSLIAQTLLQPGDAVWMEEPGYMGARQALQAAKARISPVPVDDNGIDVTWAMREAPLARLAYVTPSHQFPLGGVLPLERRLTLLDWAARAKAWIIEDDYDSEYRYVGRPLVALQGLDRAQRVIYLGTFSKVLFPALRLGYIVAPDPLIEPLLRARLSADTHSPVLEQAVVADFIEQGHFTRHLRRMRTLYAERQALLISSIERQLPQWLQVKPDTAGLHLVGWLPDGLDDGLVAGRASIFGVNALPLSFFRSEPGGRRALVLGYAASEPEAMAQGVRALATTFRSIRKG